MYSYNTMPRLLTNQQKKYCILKFNNKKEGEEEEAGAVKSRNMKQKKYIEMVEQWNRQQLFSKGSEQRKKRSFCRCVCSSLPYFFCVFVRALCVRVWVVTFLYAFCVDDIFTTFEFLIRSVFLLPLPLSLLVRIQVFCLLFYFTLTHTGLFSILYTQLL